MFSNVDATSATNGVRLSPMALSSVAATLYSAVAISPKNITRRYAAAISISAVGVRSTVSSGVRKHSPSAVISTAATQPKPDESNVDRRSPASSPAPKRCASTTPKPWVRPSSISSGNALKNDAEPTAANASTPISRPTITLSQSEYSCCNM